MSISGDDPQTSVIDLTAWDTDRDYVSMLNPSSSSWRMARSNNARRMTEAQYLPIRLLYFASWQDWKSVLICVLDGDGQHAIAPVVGVILRLCSDDHPICLCCWRYWFYLPFLLSCADMKMLIRMMDSSVVLLWIGQGQLLGIPIAADLVSLRHSS